MQPIIEIEDLSLAYHQDGIINEILHGLDLTIERGEFLAIVGASGVGKSTLLRVLMNLSAPSTGRVSVNVDPSSQRAMALVFQDARLLPWRRVLDNVTFGLEKTTASRQERRRKGLDVLRKVGIELLADRYPRQLSGGQRQRVALARALAVDAPILLMDEPFSALDALTREGLQDVLTRVWTTFGKTVLFVTHDIDEAVHLADRVIALGGQPGQVKASVTIDAPRPRSRHDPSLQSFAEKVRAQLVADALPSEDWVI